MLALDECRTGILARLRASQPVGVWGPAIRRIDTAFLIGKNCPSYLLCWESAVVPRPVLTTLVFSLPLLVVAFAVLMGGSALASATEDMEVAQALRWVAIGVLMLTVVDMVLLVGVLGLNALGRGDDRSDANV